LYLYPTQGKKYWGWYLERGTIVHVGIQLFYGYNSLLRFEEKEGDLVQDEVHEHLDLIPG
jgi:hypothetical protein